MRNLSRLLCTLTLWSLAACGGCGDNNGGSPANNGDQPVDERGFRRVLAQMCDYMERCPSDHYAIAYRSRGECVDILDFVLTCRVTEEGDDDTQTYSVEDMPVTVSDAQRQACVEWLNNVDCAGTLGGDDNPCNFLGAAFDDDDDDDERGALRGQSCERDNCIDGLECIDSAQSTEEIDYCRICVAPGGPGAPCIEPSRPCEEGLTCNWEIGLCDYPLEEGEDCSSGTRPCREGTFCTYDTRICTALYADGMSCLYEDRPSDQFCASGFCNANTGECDGAGLEGDSCGDDADCRSGQLLSCEAGKCEGPRPAGAACTEDAQCANRQCDADSGKCGLPDGSECRDDTECQSQFCSRRDFPGTCEPPRALGESCDGGGCGENVCSYDSNHNFQSCMLACTEQADCPAEHRCDGYACQPIQPDGGPCRDGEDCLSGWCSDITETCGQKPAIGDPCTGYGECYPRGYCSNGVCTARSGPGEACASLDSCLEPYLCLDGKCELMSLSCQPAAPGEMCTWLRVCDETAYCDPLDGFTCKRKVDSGASCQRSEECLGDLVCVYGPEGGTCAAPGSAGDDCTTLACGPDLYCDRSTRICGELKDPGEPCSDEDECKGEAYCDGQVCQLDNPEPECVLPEEVPQ